MKGYLLLFGILLIFSLALVTTVSADIQATVSENQLTVVLTNEGGYSGGFTSWVQCDSPLLTDMGSEKIFTLQPNESMTYTVGVYSSGSNARKVCGNCTVIFREIKTAAEAKEVVPICLAGEQICVPGHIMCKTNPDTGRKMIVQCSQDGYDWITLDICGEGEDCQVGMDGLECPNKKLKAATDNQNMLIVVLVVVIIVFVAVVYYLIKRR